MHAIYIILFYLPLSWPYVDPRSVNPITEETSRCCSCQSRASWRCRPAWRWCCGAAGCLSEGQAWVHWEGQRGGVVNEQAWGTIAWSCSAGRVPGPAGTKTTLIILILLFYSSVYLPTSTHSLSRTELSLRSQCFGLLKDNCIETLCSVFYSLGVLQP